MDIRAIDYKKFTCTGSVMQSSFWAALKHGIGWKPYAFEITHDGLVFPLLVLVKQVMPLFQLSYIPFGPPTTVLGLAQEEQLLRQLARQLRKLLPRSVFALRFDLPFDEPDDQNVMIIDGLRFKTCRESVQPEGTVRINLTKGYETVVSMYRDRAKRALRKGGQAFQLGLWNGDTPSFKRWYDVYLETARRDGFSVRSAKYLRALLSLDGKVNGDVQCKLLLATENGKIVGGIIVLFSQKEAMYLYGASLRIDSLSCSHMLQDYAIRMACEKGCTVYDLFGIPGPKGRGSHLESLELFKLSFGGHPYYRTPTTDYLYLYLPWRLYSIAELMRYRMHRKVKPQEGARPSF